MQAVYKNFCFFAVCINSALFLVRENMFRICSTASSALRLLSARRMLYTASCSSFVRSRSSRLVPDFWMSIAGKLSFPVIYGPVQFRVTGSLEFLVNNIVHLASCIDECCCKDRQTSAFSHITGCTKKSFRHVKCCRIKTAGQCPSALCHAEIVCSGKSCDRVKKDRDFLLMLYQTACTLNYHLRNASVVLRKLQM